MLVGRRLSAAAVEGDRPPPGDRPPWPLRPLHAALLGLLLLLAAAPPAAAKSYRALRFDVHAELRPDRSLAVTETVTFRFEDGTFTEVFRDVPLRWTDGVTDVAALMDGVRLSQGEEPGHVEIASGARRLRVRWHFAPRRGDHTFELRYRLLGIVTHTRDGDVLEWLVLPDERRYQIDGMRAIVTLPPGARAGEDVSVRPGAVSAEVEGQRLVLTAGELARNRSVHLHLPLTGGAFAPEAPAWQGARAAQLARGPWMLGVAALVLLGGFVWTAMFRAAWRIEPFPGPESQVTFPPDPLLPPGIAARLASAPSQAQAMATLFDLARRGVVQVDEQTSPAGRRRGFSLRLATRDASLAGHERALLAMAFDDASASREISMAQLRRRLSTRLRGYNTALGEDMRQRGLLDPDRVAARRTLTRAILVAVCLAIAGAVLAVLLARVFGPWAAALPIAFALIVLGLAVARGTFPVLTRTGLREAHRWKAFGRYLGKVGQGKAGDVTALPPDWLPYLAGAGAAAAWVKRLAKQPTTVPVPAWFRAAAQDAEDRSAAFVALITTTAVSSSPGVHAGGGAGVAGGGASGAR